MSKIMIEVSARHCHLSQSDADKLFGQNYKLKKFKKLSQPYQFAAKETVVLKTKGGQINLRVVSPIREQTQIELPMTDAYKLKIKPPVRLSGDLKGSAAGVLIGPKGKVQLKEGIIISQRHIHCDPATAKKLKLKNKQKVSVKTLGDRLVTFHNIPVRINKNFIFRLHLDTDEANASLADNKGELVKK